MKIVISSGHSEYVRGAQGIISEVTEARKVVERVADYARQAGADVITYHDMVSKTQDENLARIVDFHNSQGPHDLDVSVHFNNAYSWPYPKPIGTECFHYSGNSSMRDLAGAVASEIAMSSGLIDRGAKDNSLYFTSNTAEPAILIEVCFVESEPDVDLYRRYFEQICSSIAETITGEDIGERPPPVEPPADALFYARGPCSWFGGPDDTGVAEDEGLAFIYDPEEAPHLFLPEQPPGTSGLARRLDTERVAFCACRWDYQTTPKGMLADQRYKAKVSAKGKSFYAYPADWGPNSDTGRVCDLSLYLMETLLGLETDDEIEIIYPA
jgi:N-acetylmuramoyl-L-alanine amidase